ncbi:penicillin-binding protein 1A [Treponema saccharophilum]|uniref:peptidoglycan glycosyltransferase n=1 Tax=Treponema saccharophilum DSM 2985 TaxID=907348 RepID=H7ELG7_9SPIR|nr:PBP1A family penicillin-binding protein [Treponema saccharophilum]EIC01508.1 penicillin-binding protein, 1A family [Treponema saccharophilum DSM 2985]BDC95586.1 penicillin-binding protein [Treponema saccharophilum]
MSRIKASTAVLMAGLFLFSAIVGAALGVALSQTKYVIDNENFTEFTTALPTKLLDINGELITEFASEEKRDIISIKKLPQQMIDALIAREDKRFYKHEGFSLLALFRAVFGKLTGHSMGGGSTLTQQIAGTLYCDRSDMSIHRKLDELWWAVQMERRYTKDEILELYLNKIYFGAGTYGVSAASKYYFGHDATEITPAEAAILVIQLSNPALMNPFDYPNRAMDRQRDVLNKMVEHKFITKEDADESFEEYWATFDYSRTSAAATFTHDDKAPWFSEYVRRELGKMIYGTNDIYTSGFTVNTTLNLKNQIAAQDTMEKYIAIANRSYQRSSNSRKNQAFKIYTPISEMLSLLYGLSGIKVSEQRQETIALSTYTNTINPVIDVMSLMFGMDTLKLGIVNRSNAVAKSNIGKTTIEGTLVALENNTGYITALVGGSKFDSENQYIRAIQARIQPGSSFKPLYYSAAIDSLKYTPSTIISDTPIVFHTADGKPYIPQNFRGEWKGDVELWYALAHSMNIPSVKILDGIGFDAAIERAVALLGISDEELPSRAFVPGYPLGLGVCSVRPIENARAYAIFANGGKEVTPIAIRNVQDRNGNIFLNPEHDVRAAQQAKGAAAQIISPQTAYVMTQLLQNTVKSGSLASPTANGTKLRYTDAKGKKYTIPAAGKTGTTQNWADAWTLAYTPYYTAAVWFGFDKPGQSLGLELTGSTLAGPAWTEFMRKAHEGLPYKDFARPATGVVQATVCSVSGKLPTEECGNHKISLWFLSGTQPTEHCEYHSSTSAPRTLAVSRLEQELFGAGFASDLLITDDAPLSFNLDDEDTEQNSGNSAFDFDSAESIDRNFLLD